MYRRKIYGLSKIETCPFCDKNAITVNKQGIPVCQKHKKESLPDMKCVCGEYLDLRTGKYGPYFECMNCGNINFNKAMEMNYKIIQKIKNPEKKETTVRSDEI